MSTLLVTHYWVICMTLISFTSKIQFSVPQEKVFKIPPKRSFLWKQDSLHSLPFHQELQNSPSFCMTSSRFPWWLLAAIKCSSFSQEKRKKKHLYLPQVSVIISEMFLLNHLIRVFQILIRDSCRSFSARVLAITSSADLEGYLFCPCLYLLHRVVAWIK